MRARHLLLALTLLVHSRPAPAQQEESKVLQVVRRVFDGMRQRDTALMRSTFDANARMINTGGPNGASAMSPNAWIEAVGKGKGDAWDERVMAPLVRIDGPLAVVWTKYEFWLGAKFSHCGIDHFLMVKAGADWKIMELADTERKQGCAAH